MLALMAPNGIQKDGTASEQWRLQWRYHPFRVDRDRLTGHIFGYISRKKHRTAKIMAHYYRQLWNLLLLTTRCSFDIRPVSRCTVCCCVNQFHPSSKGETRGLGDSWVGHAMMIQTGGVSSLIFIGCTRSFHDDGIAAMCDVSVGFHR